MGCTDHVVVAGVPLRVELDSFLAIPRSSEADDTTVFNDLVRLDILIPHTPDIGLSGLGLDVENQNLRFSNQCFRFFFLGIAKPTGCLRRLFL